MTNEKQHVWNHVDGEEASIGTSWRHGLEAQGISPIGEGYDSDDDWERAADDLSISVGFERDGVPDYATAGNGFAVTVTAGVWPRLVTATAETWCKHHEAGCLWTQNF